MALTTTNSQPRAENHADVHVGRGGAANVFHTAPHEQEERKREEERESFVKKVCFPFSPYTQNTNNC